MVDVSLPQHAKRSAFSPFLGIGDIIGGVWELFAQGREAEKEEDKQDYYVRERSFGSFERTFQVQAVVADYGQFQIAVEWRGAYRFPLHN